MKRKAIIQLHVDVDLSIPGGAEIESSVQTDVVTMPEFMQNVWSQVSEVIDSKGFVPVLATANRISNLNGGFSLYNTYTYTTDESILKLVLDVRLSDHPAKPNIEKRNQARMRQIIDIFMEVKHGTASAEVLDIYCKANDWGVQIFIGGKKDYNKPVSKFEDMNRILEGKLDRFIQDHA